MVGVDKLISLRYDSDIIGVWSTDRTGGTGASSKEDKMKGMWLVSFGGGQHGIKLAENAARRMRRRGWFVARSHADLYVENGGERPWAILGPGVVQVSPLRRAPEWVR